MSNLNIDICPISEVPWDNRMSDILRLDSDTMHRAERALTFDWSVVL